VLFYHCGMAAVVYLFYGSGSGCTFKIMAASSKIYLWCYDTQHYDTQHYNTQHNDTQGRGWMGRWVDVTHTIYDTQQNKVPILC
jgi:hypothetical protein